MGMSTSFDIRGGPIRVVTEPSLAKAEGIGVSGVTKAAVIINMASGTINDITLGMQVSFITVYALGRMAVQASH